MVGPEVEGVEIEPLMLNLGAFGDLPAHADEKVGDFLDEHGERMAGPPWIATRGDGDVDLLPFQSGRGLFGLEPGRRLGQRGLNLFARRTHKLARHRFVRFLQSFYEGVRPGDGSGVAGMGEPGRFQLRERGRFGERPPSRLDGLGDGRLVQRAESLCGHECLSLGFR